jgi:hypothetical protein
VLAASLIADLPEVGAVGIGAVPGVAPAVGAQEVALTGHFDTGTSLALPVDADLSFSETAHLAAVGRVAVSSGTALVFGTGDPHTRALYALVLHAHLTVSGTGLRRAVDRVALPVRATLILGAADVQAAYLLAFLFYADLPQSGTVPPHAVLRVALASGTGHAFLAGHTHAGELCARVLDTGESVGTLPQRAIQGPALTAHDDPSLTVALVNRPGRAGDKKNTQDDQAASEEIPIHRTLSGFAGHGPFAPAGRSPLLMRCYHVYS